MTEETLYDLLEVSPSASAETIRAAYKSLMQRYHPDKCRNDPSAVDRAKRINQAYQVLSDPVRRAAYDEHLADQRSEGGARKSSRERHGDDSGATSDDEATRYRRTLAAVKRQFPELDSTSPRFSRPLLELVLKEQRHLLRQGFLPSEALLVAVREAVERAKRNADDERERNKRKAQAKALREEHDAMEQARLKSARERAFQNVLGALALFVFGYWQFVLPHRGNLATWEASLIVALCAAAVLICGLAGGAASWLVARILSGRSKPTLFFGGLTVTTILCAGLVGLSLWGSATAQERHAAAENSNPASAKSSASPPAGTVASRTEPANQGAGSVLQSSTQESAQMEYDRAVAALERQYPWINPDSRQYDQQLVDRVLARRDEYAKLGYPVVNALKMAVTEVTRTIPVSAPPSSVKWDATTPFNQDSEWVVDKLIQKRNGG